MAITGPLAFRSNEWRLGKDGRPVLTSPQRGDFEWREPLVWAECNLCLKDPDGHVILGDSHSCGIYATIRKATVANYIMSSNSILMLVEALDSNLPKGENIQMYDYGWRAPGALIVYLIDNESQFVSGSAFQSVHSAHTQTPHALAIAALAQLFHVQVISFDEAMSLCKMTWEKFDGVVWPY